MYLLHVRWQGLMLDSYRRKQGGQTQNTGVSSGICLVLVYGRDKHMGATTYELKGTDCWSGVILDFDLLGASVRSQRMAEAGSWGWKSS